MSENDAFLLIAKAAMMLAQHDPDGSINEDRVNAMFQELLAVDAELKRAAKGVIDRILHLRDSL